jgi:hypothetical protein
VTVVLGDDRIGPLREGSECFVCGFKIVNLSNGCCVQSPAAQNIQATAHVRCVNGMDASDLLQKYQSAVDAGIRGGKERPT